MRVLVVTPWFPSASHPGVGSFNQRDAELLAQDHDVTVLHLGAPELLSDADISPPGLRVLRVPYSPTRLATLRPALRSIQASLAEADLLHTMAFPALLPFALVKVRLPWVHTEHWSGLASTATPLTARIGGAMLGGLLRRPCETVAVSEYLAAAVDRHRPNPSAVIGNHVMLAAPETLSPIARTGKISAIGVGNLIAEKGPALAVETIAELVSRGGDASLTWAGTGPLRGELEGLAAELGVADRVRFLGHVPPEQLSCVLREHSLFLLPTAGETFGVAIAEALGHGLPVVTSGLGGHRDFLPPTASRAVGERTAGALADAVEDLWDDPRRPGPRAIAQDAWARFSDDTRRSDYAAVYRSANEAHARRRG